jgi:DNA-binding beta-propeller fold protein YncE
MATTSTSIHLDYVKTIGIVNNGDNGRGFANPYDLAVTRDGRIFVLNRCDPPRAAAIRVGICNLNEEYLGEFGNGGGSGDGQFIWPVAMAFDSGERLYVTDEHLHRITVFDASGALLRKWGEFGSRDGEINGPAGIAIDVEDNVYVADQHNNRVHKFTSSGKHLLCWGEPGAGPGQFNLPWGLAVDSQGQVYVADWRNDRVQKFTAGGRFLASFGEPGVGQGQFHRPSSVAVDPEGHIYVADWGNERVQVLGPDGRPQLILRGQATLSKWAGEYFASNPEEKRERDRSNLMPLLPEHLNTPYHISSQTEPYFWGPVSVKLDRKGRLYVTETNRHRFQVYQKR